MGRAGSRDRRAFRKADRRRGARDIVIDGATGLLIPPNDAGALRNALQKLLTRREIITRMGQTSLDRIAQFKAGAVVPRIEHVYHTVASTCSV